MPEQLRVDINEYQSVSAIVYPANSRGRSGVTLILGHGAGAGQTSAFMVSYATELAARGIDAVTFNFPYSEHGRRSPDPNDKLEACYRAVIESVRTHEKLRGNKLAIGGKSMGGRIASQLAASGVSDFVGLVFLGYPLHPPGNSEKLRAKHLAEIKTPMLFVQGSRDIFGTADELRPIIDALQQPATLYVVEGGDHSFKVPKSSGVTQEEAHAAVIEKVAGWLRERVQASGRKL
jgi:predicted alpha/beta-hydrolase family hydrolase